MPNLAHEISGINQYSLWSYFCCLGLNTYSECGQFNLSYRRSTTAEHPAIYSIHSSQAVLQKPHSPIRFTHKSYVQMNTNAIRPAINMSDVSAQHHSLQRKSHVSELSRGAFLAKQTNMAPMTNEKRTSQRVQNTIKKRKVSQCNVNNSNNNNNIFTVVISIQNHMANINNYWIQTMIISRYYILI